MLDWFWGEASDQVEESDEDDDSAADTSKDSISTAPSTTRKLRQHARKLTKRILQREPSEYDADESTVDNENSSQVTPSVHSSGPSYYFQSLNDRRRSRALFDEESAVHRHNPEGRSDVESGKTCDSSVDNGSADSKPSKMEKEQVRKKNKLLWIRNQYNSNENKAYGALENYEEEDNPNVSPEKLEELKKVAKERQEKRFRTISVFAIPLLILGMAGIGLYLGLTWDNDVPPNEIEDTGVASSALDGDMSYFRQNDVPWSDEGTKDDSTLGMEGTEPPVDEDFIKKHLEAYEAWKANNELLLDDDDDNYGSVDIDFLYGYDETPISLQRTNGND